MAIVKKTPPIVTASEVHLQVQVNQINEVKPSEVVSSENGNNRCDLIYGPSGVGKTENLGLGALYVWEKYGLITRLVSADGGGWKPLQPYIDLGIIQPYSIVSVKKQLGVMMAMAEGQWPSIVNGRMQLTPLSLKDIEGSEKDGIPGVGALMLEGLTSFASGLMSYLTSRNDIQLPEQPKDCFVIEESPDGSKTKYGFAGRSNYAFVQTRMQEIVARANGLPFKKVVWTALEHIGEDQETGEAVYGPEIIGKAITGKAPAWFGDCIHLTSLNDDEVIEDGRKDLHKLVKSGVPVKRVRAYMSNHPHKKTGHMYLAKGRTSAWTSKGLPPFFDVIINNEERKGLNWIYSEEDRLNDMAVGMIESQLTRPSPKEMFKIKGLVQGFSVEETNLNEVEESNIKEVVKNE